MDVDKLSNLDKFRFICKDLPSPDIFIDYNFYFLISSCLARKVWVGTDGGWQLFPNLYIWCIGDPGIGKSLPAQEVSRILRSLKQVKRIKVGDKEELRETFLVNLAPNSTSWEKLIHNATMSRDVCKRIDDPERTHYYHSSTVFCLPGEVGTLLRRNTDDIVTFLTDGWDCGDYRNDTYKHDLQIVKNMCLNFFCCSTQEKMKKLENTELMEEGLAARFIFLFEFLPRDDKPALFYTDERQEYAKKLLIQHCKSLCLMPASEIKLSQEAAEWIENWFKKRSRTRINRHPKLADYYSRKKQHIIKLALNIHFSEYTDYNLTIDDFNKALNLLERAEVLMHEARCCGGKNPTATLADQIFTSIKTTGFMSKERVIVDHFNQGNELQINEAVAFLQLAGRIMPTEKEGRGGYKICEHEKRK